MAEQKSGTNLRMTKEDCEQFAEIIYFTEADLKKSLFLLVNLTRLMGSLHVRLPEEALAAGKRPVGDIAMAYTVLTTLSTITRRLTTKLKDATDVADDLLADRALLIVNELDSWITIPEMMKRDEGVE